MLPNVQSSCQEFVKVRECDDSDEGDGDALAGDESNGDALAGGEDNRDALTGGEDDVDALAGGEDDGDALAGGEDNIAKVRVPKVKVKESEDMIDDPTVREDVIIKSLEFLTTTFPDCRFNRKWKEDNIRNVFGDLAPICDHALVVFGDIPEVPPAVSIPEVQYPTIDWTQVNTRNLTHLPIPGAMAIHGCSQDPSHYEKKRVQGYNCMEWRPSTFEENFPFGHLPGFITDKGVIAFSSEVIHGHVWSVADHKWILHASIKKMEDRRPRGREQRHRRERK